jgi:hypothetical protein
MRPPAGGDIRRSVLPELLSLWRFKSGKRWRMWWLKALGIWILISLATTGLIGRFLAGRYFRQQARPKKESLPDDSGE